MKDIKTILLTILLLTFSSTSFAWFSQPPEIGRFRIDYNRDTGIHFDKGAYNQGTKHYSKARKAYTDGYSKGIATFDGGKLSVYYDAPMWKSKIKVGEKSNSIDSVISFNNLYKVINENGRTFYLMIVSADVESDFILFGKLPNGKYAKYVDSKNINIPYFGTEMIVYEDVSVTNNAIAVHFRYFTKGGVKTGRVLLPWSESAQWFGIDVVYN